VGSDCVVSLAAGLRKTPGKIRGPGDGAMRSDEMRTPLIGYRRQEGKLWAREW